MPWSEVDDTYERQMGLPVLEVYGMAETSSVHCMAYPDMPCCAGSVGRPLPYSRVRVAEQHPRAAAVLLLIEVADTGLRCDDQA